jgi:hypothetical protein
MAGNDLVHAVHAPNIAKEAPPTTYGKLFEITTSTKSSILFAERHTNAVQALSSAH